MELMEQLRSQLASGLVSNTLNTCSRWATHRRIMGAPLEGPYSFKHHPWCEEIHDSKATYNSTMKGAQLGMTEIGINRAFFTVDVLKKDVLYVLPTAINASDFAKSRFNTALTYSDYLKNIFTDTNTIGLKQAGGVNLYIRGSRGDSNMKSIPVAVLIIDELDEMDEKQIYLALERLSGNPEKSIYYISTPTYPKKGIHKHYLQGTQEHYMFKCPHCSRQTELIYPECLEIRGEAITDPLVKTSILKCKECEHQLHHETKHEWLAKGNAGWVATAKCDEDHRSFHVNQLYSYALTPGEIALAYFRGLGDEAAMSEFFNSKLGLPFIPDGGQVTDEELEDALRQFAKTGARPLTGGERLITMGVDQGSWLHVVVMEYLLADDNPTDINAESTGRLLWEGKFDAGDFTVLDRMMREWQVRACVIDADPQINDARRFARRFPGYAWLCRYRRGVTGKELQESEADGGAPMITVDRTNWLDASMGRFHSSRIWLPRDVSLEFRENVKNLIRVFERDELGNPRATYTNTGPDHFGHALNYAEMALPLAACIGTGESITQSVI